MQVIDLDRVLLVASSSSRDAKKERYETLLGLTFNDLVEWDTGMLVYYDDRTGLELIAPASTEDDIAGYLERNGSGLYGVAFRVEDLAAAKAHLAAHGVEPVIEGGLESAPELIYHPRDFGGVYTVLTEYHHPITEG
jgi:4-hydroxyphenylpyruvate dioxygenase-like putative hemolysin